MFEIWLWRWQVWRTPSLRKKTNQNPPAYIDQVFSRLMNKFKKKLKQQMHQLWDGGGVWAQIPWWKEELFCSCAFFWFCLEMCTAGYFSASGLVPCQPCPPGQYQSRDRATTCDLCPAGTWTYLAASVSRNDCIGECGPGAAFRQFGADNLN